MRSTFDRIRHAISFEVIGLIITTPLGAWLFQFHLLEIGVVALGSATLATVWNYVYNIGFDHLLLRFRHRIHKRVTDRVIHAVLFEAGLLVILLPFIAWYLGINILQALIMDISFALFYVVYAFAFNWAYDYVFPIARRETSDSTTGSLVRG